MTTGDYVEINDEGNDRSLFRFSRNQQWREINIKINLFERQQWNITRATKNGSALYLTAISA